MHPVSRFATLGKIPDHPPAPGRPFRAFTLIELLTVIAIIGILAAIIIPTVGKVRSTARAVQCVSNLRQIHGAIQLYASEHRERFPGPLWGGQEPYYNPAPGTTPGLLAKLLADYLPTTEISATRRTNEMFMCPGWVAAGGPDRAEKKTFVVNIRPWGASHGAWDFCPFGDINFTQGQPRWQQRTLAEMTAYPLSRTWMMVDVDKEFLDGTGNTASWGSGILPAPAHGSARNVLFYDGHVERVPAAKFVPSL
ncbi:N-terminal cleavage protein [Opitutaceae bacterium TAV5]|nr:N-terminal cleavage protein [Opitutaceae bacterium TAV5]